MHVVNPTFLINSCYMLLIYLALVWFALCLAGSSSPRVWAGVGAVSGVPKILWFLWASPRGWHREDRQKLHSVST